MVTSLAAELFSFLKRLRLPGSVYFLGTQFRKVNYLFCENDSLGCLNKTEPLVML